MSKIKIALENFARFDVIASIQTKTIAHGLRDHKYV